MVNKCTVIRSQSSRSYFEMATLREKFQAILLQWRLKSSKEKFQFLYNIPKTMFEMVGVRVFSDMKITLYSQLGNLMIFYYVSMTIHTIYYWTKKNRFIFSLRCLCGMGIMISVNFQQSNKHFVLL